MREYKAYFIGGSWDGIRKSVRKEEHVIQIQKLISPIPLVVLTGQQDVVLELETYVMVYKFDDGVLIYRTRDDLDRCCR